MPELRVWLVGAGPGDPDLLTIKAARLIASADIVLHDALVTDEILALANPAAEIIPVGKRSGRHSMPQPAIDAALVAAARRGGRVVRLKGGDPTLFGRMSEEVDALRRAGIAFEVVPGITAACAAAAAAQVSLSHRGIARRVSFVTGHARAGEPLDLDYNALADPAATTVIYMGKAAAPSLMTALLATGLAPSTPVVAVTDASRVGETVVALTVATLDTIAGSEATGPTIILIGAALASRHLRADASAARPGVSCELP